ncbi:hypothetical protein YOLOSWAG_172 [Erwinia phage vB_EamM_Yoloswag]|uniref:Uncharacterized protein n=1 Tax=Erwinia phage vB_EamM_Yoloswag TaxID=1958956 RepID=A0A1S6L387_9CAUD|nr:hypothetical protein HOR66_gp172 [Erwinia phage vB_EamM_Yoloswag]AQT28651.1 hypothetical protein YOLOSWAG_172 [Erwinia phage vB_EamM_Yoloswag]
MSETNERLRATLADLARGDSTSALSAQALLQSISADRTPITLPQSVLDVMENGGLPTFVAYTQEDLLRLVDVLAQTIRAAQRAAEADEDDDHVDLLQMIAEYRDIYKQRTNDVIASIDTLDAFQRLQPMQRYALASALLDLATDRKIPASPLWRKIIDNNGKLGGA